MVLINLSMVWFSGLSCAATVPADGFIFYLDSDRTVKGPFLPEGVRSTQKAYSDVLLPSGITINAYNAFLAIVSAIQPCMPDF